VVGGIVDGLAACHSRADIVFVVDSSGSINEHDRRNWQRVKNFAKSIVGKLDIGEDRVRVGMVEFGNEAWIQFHLNEHYNIPDITDDIDRSVRLSVCSPTSARRYVKLAFHDADTDTDILARIVARMSACRSACHRNSFRKSRVSDVSARIIARMSVSVSVSVPASWNYSLKQRELLYNYGYFIRSLTR